MNREESIAFIICTNNRLWFDECKKYIERLRVPEGIRVEIIPISDATGMANGYNKGRIKSDAKYKIYMHHDVFIINDNLIGDLVNIFKNNPHVGLVGLVGANDIKNDSVSVGKWEYGKVLACSGYSEVNCNFGDVIEAYEPVDCVDGMFIATQYDIEWREDIFQDWHFYDRSICMEYKRAGYICVVPKQEIPWCIHDCGINSLIGWKKNMEKFLKEYEDYFSEKALEKSSAEEIDEESRIALERLGDSIEVLVNSNRLSEAIEAMEAFMELGMLSSKKLMFMLEFMELYTKGNTELFFKKDDTVDKMIEKYTRAKFILRRIVYGMDIIDEEIAFVNSLSEEEKNSIICHNLQASVEVVETQIGYENRRMFK